METLIVPKRKVQARVRLADSTVFDGALYAALRKPDGRPERIAERLNDGSERYLPIALEDQHVLLRKAGIVTVELSKGQEEAESSASEEAGVRELRLRLGLSDGSSLQGKVHAAMPAAHARPLDYLNRSAPSFVTVLVDGQVVMVNGDYVIAVSEVTDRTDA